MYMRITTGRFDPAKAEDVVRLSGEVTAAVSRLPGFQHLHQGFDRTAGTAAVVSIWDTEEHARFSREGLGEVVNRLQAAGAQLDPPQIYEIVTEG
jgi:heme-degrading monooxygenase HmoA